METTELRIGNFISINFGSCADGEIVTVDGIVECDIYNEEYGYSPCNEFKPIPLTEKWLLDFGFEIERNHYDKGKLSILLADNNNDYYKNGRVFYKSWAIMEAQPKHVHQLQNLYFALTQEELILKEITL